MNRATEQIRRVKVTSMDEITIESAERPVAAVGEVLVRPTIVGVCGSDMHAAQGSHPFIDLPYYPGHEAVGVVEEVADGVAEIHAGQRVVIEPNLACGRCSQCGQGRYNICAELAVFGCQTTGALADVFTIAADRVVPLPESMSDLEAALIEPLATPVHAVSKGGDLAGQAIVIIGAGPIGLGALIAAKAKGAAVIVTDLMESKRERAARLGADHVVDAGGDVVDEIRGLGHEISMVIDCVAREGSMAHAVDMVTKGGLIVVVGVGLAGMTPIRLDLVQDRELRIEGCLMYTRADYEVAMDLIGSSKVPVDDIVTAVFPFEETAAAFRASTDPEQVKVLVAVDATAGEG